MVNIKASAASDFERICRSCLCLCKSGKLIPLYKPYKKKSVAKTEFVESNETIGRLMMKCADVRIDADDGLPQNVCQKCVADIRAAFAYRQKCERSDAELRRIFPQFASVKQEGQDDAKECDDEAELGLTDDHWIEEFDSEIVSETDLKTENAQSCADIEDSTFQNDFGSTSPHSFEAETTNFDGGIDAFDEKQEEDEKANASSEKSYTCEICSKVFNRKYNWRQHKLVHSDEKNFKCHVCSQEYKSENNLKRHLRNHPETPEKMQMETNKTSNKNAILVKNFPCDICSKAFTRAYALNQHKFEHVNAKCTFSCGICLQEHESRRSAISCRHDKRERAESDKKSRKKKKKKQKTERIFVCEICSKVFNRRYNLKQHQMTHSDRKNFSCDICKGEFMKKSVLRRHLEKHVQTPAEVEKPVNKNNRKIKKENRLAPSTGWSQHVKKEKVCEFCSKVFSRTYNLNQHRLIHTGENRHTCNVCERTYKSRSSVKLCRHLKERHLKERHLKERPNEVNDDNYFCDICNGEFKKKSELKKHMKTHLERPVKMNHGSYRLNSSVEKGEKKKKICEFCSREFTRTYNLNQHRMIHTGEKKYSCDICNQGFKAKRNLKTHLHRHLKLQMMRSNAELNGGSSSKEKKIKVKTVKTYVCEVCAKPFKSISNLHSHRLVHSNVRNFACDICESRFKTKNHLKNHMRIHYGGSNIYSHLCSVCGTRYQNVTRLVEHMRKHTGERPYECDICHKAFHKYYNLTTHKKIHALVKPYNCLVCNRGFTIKDRLRVHMMLHTGERPYKCTMCPAGFVQGCLLKEHMRTHTGEMPYLCGVCGVRYQHRSRMLKHRREFGHFEPKNEFETNSRTEAKYLIQN